MIDPNCSVAIGCRNRHDVLEYLRLKGTWVTAKEIALALSIPDASVHCHCRNWIAMNFVEESLIKIKTHENMPLRFVIHYRFIPND